VPIQDKETKHNKTRRLYINSTFRLNFLIYLGLLRGGKSDSIISRILILDFYYFLSFWFIIIYLVNCKWTSYKSTQVHYGLFQFRWCEPYNHVVTQPTIKIEIWSRKAKIGMIGDWHNGNLPQGTNTIRMTRMTLRSQLIFDKSYSVRSKTEEWKNHSHTLKLKNSEVIIIKGCRNLGYMCLNSS
jgi:hypothetical protein